MSEPRPDAPIPAPLHEFLDRLADRAPPVRDPLDDEAICAWLDAHPQWLEPFARLRSRLLAVAAAEHTRVTATASVRRSPARRTTHAALAAMALLLGAAATAALLSERPQQQATAKAPLLRPQFAATARVVSSSTTTSVRDASAAFTTVIEVGNLSRQRRSSYSVQCPPAPGVPLCTIALTAQRGLRP